MQFARADDSIVFTLSIGSLNWLDTHQSWAYVFNTGYGFTTAGDPITKCRLLFNNPAVIGAWVNFGPVVAGTWDITGLNITNFEYSLCPYDTGADLPPQVYAINIEVASGAFINPSELEVVAEKYSCGDHVTTIVLSNDPPPDPLVPAIATKMRYVADQLIDGNIDWEGKIGTESKLRKYT